MKRSSSAAMQYHASMTMTLARIIIFSIFLYQKIRRRPAKGAPAFTSEEFRSHFALSPSKFKRMNETGIFLCFIFFLSYAFDNDE